MSSQYAQLAANTIIVADTGDISSIKAIQPTDATTNPSLIYQAVQDPQYASLLDEAIESAIQYCEQNSLSKKSALVHAVLDRVAVNFGAKIVQLIPGVVSTEIDSRLSFDTEGSIKKAKEIIALYEAKGVTKDKILIKLASTWEGIQAAKVLEQQGIHCNMTLLFCMAQAVACSNVKATLISPFVGRILDWFNKNVNADGSKDYASVKDPGVISVTQIYNYYKSIGSKTIVMGASFRNKGEILALNGCDKLTISPKLIQELKDSSDVAERILSPANSATAEETQLTEAQFRWQLNDDAMATEKLAEGIRNFTKDTEKLEAIIKAKLGSLNIDISQ